MKRHTTVSVKTATTLLLLGLMLLQNATVSADPPAYWNDATTGNSGFYAPPANQTPPAGSAYNPYAQQQQAPTTLYGYVSTVPVGTRMTTTTSSYLSSATAQIGDPVSLALGSDLAFGGQVVLPAGTQIQGQVVSVLAGRRLSRPGQLQLRFNRAITPDGRVFPISARIKTDDNSGIIKAGVWKSAGVSAAKNAVGGAVVGAGLGALVGAIAGRGKADDYALRGLAWGGAAGLGKTAYERGEEIELSPGTPVDIVLDQPMTANPSQGAQPYQQQAPYNPYAQPQQQYAPQGGQQQPSYYNPY